MKKLGIAITAALLAALCVLSIAAAQETGGEVTAMPEAAFTFRDGITFGMSPADVKTAEEAEPAAVSARYLVYPNHRFAGAAATLYYVFDDTLRLTRIGIDYDAEFPQDEQYITAFTIADRGLALFYGKATYTARHAWHMPPGTDVPGSYGRAVTAGELDLVSYWGLPDVTIIHALVNRDGRMAHGIVWTDPAAASRTRTDGI